MTLKTALEVTRLAPKPVNRAAVRRSANYHPDIWGDRFTTFVSDDEALNTWRVEAEELKEKVRKMLIDENTAVNHPKKLDLIDTVLRLGISYHYEQEIDDLLAQIFNHIQDCSIVDYDLHQTALLFRLLRQDGHFVSSEMIFNKFKDSNGKLKKSDIRKDISGLLSLYEAAHLRVHGEDILEEALEFTKTSLSSVVAANSSHPLAKLIQYALIWPVHKSVPRVSARHYISLYQELENHDETLLRFAKLDFNILQKTHQKELSGITRWWKGLDVQSKLPWARDRIVECYLWILEVYSEPQFAFAREFMTRVLALTTIIDDFYDVFGMHEELVLFTEAVERWEISAIDMLPEYMRPFYKVLLNEYSEMEEQLSKEGNAYRIDYAKEAVSA
ncbi:(-)-germacrene D synthase-like protein [Drosera capensis]